ncbi:hypothetical protein FQR65_LT04537 [Abscondita terminalis]|nr:hypothetical protein FQR65_LT04537 [Abscondita terminalis]
MRLIKFFEVIVLVFTILIGGSICKSAKMITDDHNRICNLSSSSGLCRAQLFRWRYSSEHGNCVQFVYGGCFGNANNFKSYEECTHFCKL